MEEIYNLSAPLKIVIKTRKLIKLRRTQEQLSFRTIAKNNRVVMKSRNNMTKRRLKCVSKEPITPLRTKIPLNKKNLCRLLPRS